MFDCIKKLTGIGDGFEIICGAGRRDTDTKTEFEVIKYWRKS